MSNETEHTRLVALNQNHRDHDCTDRHDGTRDWWQIEDRAEQMGILAYVYDEEYARLFAAAPELLGAVGDVVAGALASGDDGVQDTFLVSRDELEGLQHAIAKAKGQT